MGLRGSAERSQRKMKPVEMYLTPPAVPVPTWEYAVVQFSNLEMLASIREQFDAMGAFGWEMCERRETGTGPARGDHFSTFIFKRRTS